jgi:hypothetical protein
MRWKLKVKVVFKGKPVHKITLGLIAEGHDQTVAFQCCVDELSKSNAEHVRTTIDGYSFKSEDVLYYSLTDYEEANEE